MKLVDRKVVARIGVPLVFCLAFFGVQGWLVAGGKGEAVSQTFIADGRGSTPQDLIAQVTKAQVNPAGALHPRLETNQRTILRPEIQRSKLESLGAPL